MTTNKALKGLFSLSHNIKLFIPGTVNINQEIEAGEWVEDTQILFSDLFGGATTYKAIGSWASMERGLVNEKIIVVESFGTSEQVEAGLDKVISWATVIKLSLKQEAVAIEYDGKLYFV